MLLSRAAARRRGPHVVGSVLPGMSAGLGPVLGAWRAMANSASGESLLTRVIRLLEQFGPEVPELRLASLARRAGLPLSTTHRLVEELLGFGLLERTDDGALRTGVRLWELGLRASPVVGLREAARPVMEDLLAVVHQHVSIGVLDGRDVLYLERLSAPGATTNLTRVAGRLHAHAVSGGQVLLAYASPEVRDAFLARPLEQLTERTITDPDRLRQVLAEVRRSGYAVARGQVEASGTGVAAPVRGVGGTVVAALSLTVPNELNPQRLVPALLTAALGISRALVDGLPGLVAPRVDLEQGRSHRSLDPDQ